MKNVIQAADLFCGAGGTSTGLLQAAHNAGREVHLLAINHWRVAVETHRRNHPLARHLATGLEAVTPADVVPDGRLDLLWASPSCTHHSVARSGKPRSNQLRAQPHLILDWLDQLYVRRLIIENVPEFTSWGPLGANGMPLTSKRGVLFDDYLRSLAARGYKADWRIICCADYGDPTTRRRFFLQAVRGRERIRWPEPTHSENPEGLFGPKNRWVPAREIIDLSIPSQSLFRRKKPLSPNTLRRIEAGIKKFWGAWAEPFLIVLRGTKDGTPERTCIELDHPLPTLAARVGHIGLVEPFLANISHGNPDGNFARRTHSIDRPYYTLTGLNEQALVSPFLVSFYGNGEALSIDEPFATVTCKDRFGVVQQYGLDILFRMLQPRELAKAHSFPDTYHFSGTKSDIVRQIGNSVPVKTARALCEAALSA